jgi:hypothetical protein
MAKPLKQGARAISPNMAIVAPAARTRIPAREQENNQTNHPWYIELFGKLELAGHKLNNRKVSVLQAESIYKEQVDPKKKVQRNMSMQLILSEFSINAYKL